jgi:uncharacterized protein (DUF1697 family)
MKIYISILRGINVGGINRIKMEELKELYETIGLRDVKTFDLIVGLSKQLNQFCYN